MQRVRLPALSDSIRFLPDQHNTGHDYLPPLRPPAIQKLPILELVLAAEMVLTKCFGVCLQVDTPDEFARFPVEHVGQRFDRIAVEGGRSGEQGAKVKN